MNLRIMLRTLVTYVMLIKLPNAKSPNIIIVINMIILHYFVSLEKS